jgi:hypothetical protein
MLFSTKPASGVWRALLVASSRVLKKRARRELLSVIHYLRQDSEMARARWRQ